MPVRAVTDEPTGRIGTAPSTGSAARGRVAAGAVSTRCHATVTLCAGHRPTGQDRRGERAGAGADGGRGGPLRPTVGLVVVVVAARHRVHCRWRATRWSKTAPPPVTRQTQGRHRRGLRRSGSQAEERRRLARRREEDLKILGEFVTKLPPDYMLNCAWISSTKLIDAPCRAGSSCERANKPAPEGLRDPGRGRAAKPTRPQLQRRSCS